MSLIRSKKLNQSRQSGTPSTPRSMKTQQYYRSSKEPTPQRNSEPESKKNYLGWAAAIAVLLAFGYSLVLRPDSRVNLSSEAYRQNSEYKAYVDSKLSGLANSNKITFNDSTLVDELKKKYPEIDKVDINIPLIGSNIVADIKIAEPKVLLKSAKDSYLIDGQGRAVAKNTTYNNSKLITLNDQTGFKNELSKQVLTSDQVQFMQYIAAQTKARSIAIKKMVLPASSAGELFIYPENQPYFVKFILDGTPADIQMGAYLAILNELNQQGKQPKEYIDVRVEGKAFVK